MLSEADRPTRLRAAAASKKVTYHGGNAVLRTARKPHYCAARDNYPAPCQVRIEPGTQYVRSVMFPNHDASGYDKPVTHDTCLSCAANYLYLDDLATVAAKPEPERWVAATPKPPEVVRRPQPRDDGE